MKKSEINFTVTLDDQNIPEKIQWNATDQPGELSESRLISLSVWDHEQRNTLRIDLWTKEMPVDEMKRFAIDTLGGLAQSILTATGDTYMSEEVNQLCDRLVKHVEEEKKSEQG